MKSITARIAAALTKNWSTEPQLEPLTNNAVYLTLKCVGGFNKDTNLVVQDTESGSRVTMFISNFKHHPHKNYSVDFLDTDQMSFEDIVSTVESTFELMGLRTKSTEHSIERDIARLLKHTFEDEESKQRFTPIQWLDKRIKEKSNNACDYANIPRKYNGIQIPTDKDDNKVAALVEFFEDEGYHLDTDLNSEFATMNVEILVESINRLFKVAKVDQSVSLSDVVCALLVMSVKGQHCRIYDNYLNYYQMPLHVMNLPMCYFDLAELGTKV